MKGFTLIEVLVVIAIVGILSAIVVGGVQTSKLSESEQCKQYGDRAQKDLPVKCLKYYK